MPGLHLLETQRMRQAPGRMIMGLAVLQVQRIQLITPSRNKIISRNQAKRNVVYKGYGLPPLSLSERPLLQSASPKLYGIGHHWGAQYHTSLSVL
jgi:hypothetical protein